MYITGITAGATRTVFTAPAVAAPLKPPVSNLHRNEPTIMQLSYCGSN